jgi:hypothetical protein
MLILESTVNFYRRTDSGKECRVKRRQNEVCVLKLRYTKIICEQLKTSLLVTHKLEVSDPSWATIMVFKVGSYPTYQNGVSLPSPPEAMGLKVGLA